MSRNIAVLLADGFEEGEALFVIDILRRAGFTGLIETDGGVAPDNLQMQADKGVRVFVMGTALFHAADPAEMMVRLHAMGAGVPEK